MSQILATFVPIIYRCYIIRCRDKLDSEPKKKAVFSGYSTGPRIAGVVYDKHLDKSMKDAQKRASHCTNI